MQTKMDIYSGIYITIQNALCSLYKRFHYRKLSKNRLNWRRLYVIVLIIANLCIVLYMVVRRKLTQVHFIKDTGIGKSALHICATKVHIACYHFLVKHGVHKNCINNYGYTPALFYCCWSKKYESFDSISYKNI